MKVGIVAQRDNPRAASLASDVADRLRTDDVAVVVDEVTAAHLAAESDQTVTGVAIDEMATCDLVVSIGGDGTFLFAARGARTTPVMGVNLGEVGFLNAVPPAEAVAAVSDEVEAMRTAGTAKTRSMSRLGASGADLSVPPAINEIAVLGPQRGHGQGLDLEVTVDGDLYAAGHADGVLVATPTGSTAYNLSEGGPLIHPGVDGFVITEMAGEEPMPPLVIDQESTVEITLSNADEAVVVSDGREDETVEPPATITLRRADEPVHIAGPPLDFFAGLGKLD
ncbi:NAD(+)/NADH kinase [Halorientalis salina]|uniref:NAD(+)/NADH kinase n=1 Tax=Halorientalis salina TaxID=2932266 RepID=UPI0010AC08CF|nr:NAD(+)/NADH kinase [Halorientalis salina]